MELRQNVIIRNELDETKFVSYLGNAIIEKFFNPNSKQPLYVINNRDELSYIVDALPTVVNEKLSQNVIIL
jgi:hypothetical protein